MRFMADALFPNGVFSIKEVKKMPVIEKLKGYLRETILIRQNKNQCTGGCSLLCNNCTGGVILHEFGLRFDTPTINTWIPDEDFLRFAENIAFLQKTAIENPSESKRLCFGVSGGCTCAFHA